MDRRSIVLTLPWEALRAMVVVSAAVAVPTGLHDTCDSGDMQPSENEVDVLDEAALLHLYICVHACSMHAGCAKERDVLIF